MGEGREGVPSRTTSTRLNTQQVYVIKCFECWRQTGASRCVWIWPLRCEITAAQSCPAAPSPLPSRLFRRVRSGRAPGLAHRCTVRRSLPPSEPTRPLKSLATSSTSLLENSWSRGCAQRRCAARGAGSGGGRGASSGEMRRRRQMTTVELCQITCTETSNQRCVRVKVMSCKNLHRSGGRIRTLRRYSEVVFVGGSGFGDRAAAGESIDPPRSGIRLPRPPPLSVPVSAGYMWAGMEYVIYAFRPL